MSTATADSQPQANRSRFPLLVLGAIGVVFGDIGTSPLYALKEMFGSAHGMALTEANVLGSLSLIFWTLAVVSQVLCRWKSPGNLAMVVSMGMEFYA